MACFRVAQLRNYPGSFSMKFPWRFERVDMYPLIFLCYFLKPVTDGQGDFGKLFFRVLAFIFVISAADIECFIIKTGNLIDCFLVFLFKIAIKIGGVKCNSAHRLNNIACGVGKGRCGFPNKGATLLCWIMGSVNYF